MNSDNIKQEILFLTGTSFSQRPLIENDGQDNSGQLSQSEKLEKAIWTGMLDELLPEIISEHARLFGKHRQRCIIAHGKNVFGAGENHALQHGLDVFFAETKSVLQAQRLQAREHRLRLE